MLQKAGMRRFRQAARLLVLVATVLVSPAAADPPTLSPEWFLPGDAARVTAPDVQEYARMAAGGPGYLVVWEEHRPVISGVVNSAYTPLAGNQIDIYGVRLDASGAPLDAGPILICQQARNQQKPQVAWNAAANAWLVVWSSERPDWYFYRDIVGVRVSATGQVLDPSPIPLRPETGTPSNNYAEYPTVASDGVNWLVAWIDLQWTGQTARPNVAGKRVNAAGVVLDALPVVLYQHPDPVFGPIVPHLAWATDEYLLVWERAGIYTIHGLRIGSDLHHIDAAPFTITSAGFGPRVATNGTDFLVSTRQFKVHRVTHAGVSLDPSGIALPTPQLNDFRGPDVAWNGSNYLVVNAGISNGTAATWMTRISTGGAIVGFGVVKPTGDDQYNPTIASAGGGAAIATWGERDAQLQFREDIRGSRVDANGIGGPVLDPSAGQRRQTYLSIAENGSERLLVYFSEGGGQKRLVAQRTSATGQAIDQEPVEVATFPEAVRVYPTAAWNGSNYLISWDRSGSIYGRRMTAAGQFVDLAPVLLVTDSASGPAVCSLGGDFYLAYVHTFSGDQNYLKGVRVSGSSLAPIGAPVQIGPGFVVPPVRAEEVDGRAFLVYEDQGNHDVAASTITALFVEGSGIANPSFHVGTAFDEDMPSVALADDRILVTWSDRENYDPSAIVGRLLHRDGSFRTATFLIAEAPNEQMFSDCAWDGNEFVAVWTDYRNVASVEQLRGNIWAARIEAGGLVVDPGGFPVTDDPLPEDLAAVTGAGGKALIGYSRLSGAAGPEVQRIGFRLLGVNPAEVAELAPPSDWSIGPQPFRDHLRISYAGRGEVHSDRVVEIVAIDGRRVARLPMAGSAGSVEWDGRDGNGASVANGVYLVRVSDGGRQLVQRKVTRIE